MSLHIKNFKKILQKLKNNKITIGTWLQLNDPNVAYILSKSNFEWVVADLEHGSFSFSNLYIIFRSIAFGNSLPFARLHNHEKSTISKTLDAGAFGIILPNVEDHKQMKKIINYASYPPLGKRGVGFAVANNFGSDLKDYLTLFKKPIIIAMIESKTGVENLENILKCKGLDGILIGPYDLSASLNVTGNFKSKKFVDTVNKIIKICKSNNISVGVHQVKKSLPELNELIEKGFNFIPYGMDTVFLSNNYPKK